MHIESESDQIGIFRQNSKILTEQKISRVLTFTFLLEYCTGHHVSDRIVLFSHKTHYGGELSLFRRDFAIFNTVETGETANSVKKTFKGISENSPFLGSGGIPKS